MGSTSNIVEKYQTAIVDRERELILLRQAVWGFLGTEHTSSDTKTYQSRVRESDIKIGLILSSLLDNKDKPADFRHVSETLCKQCRDLHDYTKTMGQALSDDLDERRHIEDKKTIDVIKNVSFFFAVPVAMITAVKNGVVDGMMSVTSAAIAGVGLSTAILARKRIMSAFKKVAKDMIDAPQQIRNSFWPYYVREIAKENKAAFMRRAGGAKLGKAVR